MARRTLCRISWDGDSVESMIDFSDVGQSTDRQKVVSKQTKPSIVSCSQAK
jgi:hypothetical protein